MNLEQFASRGMKAQAAVDKVISAHKAASTERPAIGEILAAIDTQIAGLVDSFTDRIGPTKGKISNKKISREIVCLRAAREIVLEAA